MSSKSTSSETTSDTVLGKGKDSEQSTSNDAKSIDTKPVIIYTDGSALNNGKAGARAGVGVFFGHNDPRYT